MTGVFSFDEIRKTTTGALDRAKLVFHKNGEEQEEGEEEESQQPDRLEELSAFCPSLTWQQRLIGFVSCFSIGYMIAFFSFKFFIKLVEGHPVPFAVNYTFGHILQLMASTFLCGPQRQFRNMFDDKRRITSITYLTCLVSTLVVLFLPLPRLLMFLVLVLLTLTQFCASVWYSLSYIPYGRRTLSKYLKRQLGLQDEQRGPIPGVMGAFGGGNTAGA